MSSIFPSLQVKYSESQVAKGNWVRKCVKDEKNAEIKQKKTGKILQVQGLVTFSRIGKLDGFSSWWYKRIDEFLQTRTNGTCGGESSSREKGKKLMWLERRREQRARSRISYLEGARVRGTSTWLIKRRFRREILRGLWSISKKMPLSSCTSGEKEKREKKSVVEHRTAVLSSIRIVTGMTWRGIVVVVDSARYYFFFLLLLYFSSASELERVCSSRGYGANLERKFVESDWNAARTRKHCRDVRGFVLLFNSS